MTALTIYKGLSTIDTPVGTGSQHVENQTKALADRAPTVNYAATVDPDADYDSAATYSAGAGVKYYVGSIIHNVSTSPVTVWRCVDESVGAAIWLAMSLVDAFLDLDDTPSSFTGDRVLRVNSGGTAVEFVTDESLDTNAVTLQGRTLDSAAPSVNQAIVWDGAQWAPGSPVATTDLLSLTDITDASYVGHNGHILRVNAGLTGMELIDGTTIYAAASHTHAISAVTNLQTTLDAKLALAGGTMTGAIAMGANNITGLGRMTLDIGGFLIYPSTLADDGFWIIADGLGTSKYFQQDATALNLMGADLVVYASAQTVGSPVAGTAVFRIDGVDGALEWPDTNCRIRRVSDDLVFTDPNSGSFTLGQLSNTGTTIDDISGLREFVNEAFLFTQRSVLDRNLATPPGSPAPYAAYLVATGGTGTWSGQSNNIAFYYSGVWYFIEPVEGMNLWVSDEDVSIQYDGSNWLEVQVPKVFGVAA